MPKTDGSAQSSHRNPISTTFAARGGTLGSSWSAKDDETFVATRGGTLSSSWLAKDDKTLVTARGGTLSSSWSIKDDEILIAARAQGLNWNQIAPKHFPAKSPNACRKRHERLMERKRPEEWDGIKLDVLAQGYINARCEMWSILAARVGVKWQLVEQKCMEKGLKNLGQAYRSSQKRNGTYEEHGDSGIGHSDLEEENDVRMPDISDSPFQYQQGTCAQRRVPSIQSMFQYSGPTHQTYPPLPGNSKSNYDVDEGVGLADRQEKDLGEPESPASTSLQIAEDVCGAGLVDAPKNNHISPSPGIGAGKSVTCSPSSGSTSTSSIGDCEEITRQKEKILNRLMLRFYEMFDTSNRFACRPSQETQSSSSAFIPETRTEKGSGSSSTRNSKRKLDEISDNNIGEDNDDGPSKPPKRPDKPGDTETEEKRPFACPFFKHNPRKYRGIRACSGPGWDTIHRVKEHLYRRHAMSPQCPRCNRTFEDTAKLKDHLRTLDGCKVQEREPLEGIDKEKEQQLRCRKRVFRAESEEQKWKDVYLILFPDTDPFALPSPYYESDDFRESSNNTSPKPREIVKLEEYLSRELPRIVRQELKTAIDQTFGPIEETLASRLENIVRSCQESATRAFLQNLQPPSNPSIILPSIEHPPQDFEYINNNGGNYGAGVPEALAPYAIPAESTLDPWLVLEGPSTSFPDMGSDSTYHSEGGSIYPSFSNDASSSGPSNWSSHSTNQPCEYIGMMSDLDEPTTNPCTQLPKQGDKGKRRAL